MAVDMHGGRINVETKEGEGTRFVVRLPIRREAMEDFPSLATDTVTMEDMSQ
jgi:signal transduction histidine kinase